MQDGYHDYVYTTILYLFLHFWGDQEEVVTTVTSVGTIVAGSRSRMAINLIGRDIGAQLHRLQQDLGGITRMDVMIYVSIFI